MPEDPETQFRRVFEKIGLVPHEAALAFQSIVEMTSDHVGLREHLDLFNAIRLEFLEDAYPAWTAVEVAGLRHGGAIVEVRVIAHTDPEH
jgi:enamine deaminase RidA (YjgF/YER057c/UK114 family)